MDDRRNRNVPRWPERRSHPFRSPWPTASMTKCEDCGVLHGEHPAFPDPFDREAYLSLADEFDPIGRSGPAPSLDDFDETAVAAARRYAARHSLPFPMRDGIDIAMAYVVSAEWREASGA